MQKADEIHEAAIAALEIHNGSFALLLDTPSGIKTYALVLDTEFVARCVEAIVAGGEVNG